MASLAEHVSATAASKGTSFSRASLNRTAAASGGLNMVITLQGERVLAEHFYMVAQAADPIVQQLVLFFGEATKEVAKQIHQPNIDTGETYDSISAGPDPKSGPTIFRADGGWAIDVGPHTEYSQFQEFGFTHYLSGDWIQNPFMMPAADIISPLFEDAMTQLAEIAGNRRYFSGPAAQSGAGSILGSIRNSLYSYSKFAGDIQILGIGGFSGSRGVALRGAQALGDADSLMRGAIGTRISRRVSGRFVSQGIATRVSTSFSGPGTSFTGSSNRIYNRIRGQVFGRNLRGL